MTQSALALRILCHESLVSHVEKGRRDPTLEFAREVDKAFGADGHFTGLHERISHSPALGWFARWVEEIEPQAVIMYSRDPLVIPGMLQTVDYARAVFAGTGPPEQVEEQVQARIQRIGIFQAANPPSLLAVIEEGVLHRPFGGAGVLVG